MDDKAEMGESGGPRAHQVVRATSPPSRADDEPTHDENRLPVKHPASSRIVAVLSHIRMWHLRDATLLPFYIMTAAAIVGAVITLRAAMLGSEAGQSLARGIHAETMRDNFLATTSDYVFLGTAPNEMARAEATLYERGLLHAARRSSGRARLALLSEAKVQDHVRTLTTNGRSILAGGDTYLSRPGQYIVGDHLASAIALGNSISPSRHQAIGNSLATRATVAMSMTVPAAVSFLFGTLAFALPRRRRTFLLLGFATILASLLALLLSILGVA